MSMLNTCCPICGYRFDGALISPCLGIVRKAVKCSGCGADVILSRRAWRMTIGGLMFAITLLAVSDIISSKNSRGPEELYCLAFAVLAFCVSVVGFLSLHFEKVRPADQHPQPAPQ